MDCGNSYPHYVMEFDHARGEKVANIPIILMGSLDALFEELEKCDVVCANCHSIRTHRRRQ